MVKVDGHAFHEQEVQECVLCGVRCDVDRVEDMTIFHCATCYPFRMSHDAIERLAGLGIAHRNALMYGVWQAHLKGKLAEITLATDDGFRIFQTKSVEPIFLKK